MDLHWHSRPGNRLPVEIGIRSDFQDANCLVSISGRITIDSSPELRVLLLKHLHSPACQSLTVGFHDVEYMDTSGLAILVELLRAACAVRKSFHLSGLQGKPRFLFETTRLLHLFDDQGDAETRPCAESTP